MWPEIFRGRIVRMMTTASFTLVFPFEILMIRSVSWAMMAAETIFGVEGEEEVAFEV